jgi:hypothetical protein
MATRRSSSRSTQQLQKLPEMFLERLLPGAARAGGKVVADAAKQILGSKTAETGDGGRVLVADAVKVRIKRDGIKIRGKITMIGPGAYVGRWLEYGTDPHFISVRGAGIGMTANRANRRLRDGDAELHASLFINGKPVGTTVYHPGGEKKPFLRPAYDGHAEQIVPAMLDYLRARITRAGFITAAPEVEE